MSQAIGVDQSARTFQQAPGGQAGRPSAYANARFSDVHLASHPMLTAACGILVTAAMALTFTRRPALAALLVCAAAAVPWIPAIDFLHHVWQLAPVSTRG
jgi:hypothetical protein